MDVLVVYYTRSGNTKKLAQAIADHLHGDLEQITDQTRRAGIIGWLRAGRDAMKEQTTTITGDSKDPSNYDLVILCTPVWAGRMTPAIRTYITKYASSLPAIAAVCTCGGSNGQTLASIASLCEKAAVSTLEVTAKSIKSGDYLAQARSFIETLSAHTTT